jgi:hypothetical protein
MLSNTIKALKMWELPFLLALFALNLFCAFTINPGGVDILHLSLSAVMLMMAGERLEKKVKEK